MSKRSAQRARGKQREEQALEQRGEAILAPPETLAPEQQLARVAEIVERAQSEQSQQPRFQATPDAQQVFQSTYRFVRLALLQNQPQDNAPVRQWDSWLREVIKAEPFLLGVFNSVVQIDKNRGWSLTGGRNQVARYTAVLRGADEGAGWRPYVDWQSQSFYFAQAGFVTECGRDGENGPLRALWSVDPARIELTGKRDLPLRYFPPNGNVQDWLPGDYFRGASLISTDESKRGYGYPAVARCLELARIMIGIYELYGEATLTKEPQGVITGKNITQDMWTTALQSYDQALQAKNRVFGKLMTMMSDGTDAPEFAIQLFRRLPEGFDLDAWTNLLMYGYALEFGYDPREFFPVSGGQLGTAKETEAQHRKATSKGDKDFALAHQDQLQKQLPDTILFEYEQRDVEGETADAIAAKSKAELITEINKWLVNSVSVLSADQIMQLAAQHGIIPEEWTLQEEDVVATDTDPQGLERVRGNENIRRAAWRFPKEPIVRYHGRNGRTELLFESGEQMLAPRLRVITVPVQVLPTPEPELEQSTAQEMEAGMSDWLRRELRTLAHGMARERQADARALLAPLERLEAAVEALASAPEPAVPPAQLPPLTVVLQNQAPGAPVVQPIFRQEIQTPAAAAPNITFAPVFAPNVEPTPVQVTAQNTFAPENNVAVTAQNTFAPNVEPAQVTVEAQNTFAPVFAPTVEPTPVQVTAENTIVVPPTPTGQKALFTIDRDSRGNVVQIEKQVVEE